MRCATPPTLIHTQLTITHLFIAAPYLFETRASAPLLVWPPLQYAPRGDGSARSMGGMQDRPPSLGGASGRPAASLPAPSVVGGDPQDLPSLDYELQQLGIKVIHQVRSTHLTWCVSPMHHYLADTHPLVSSVRADGRECSYICGSTWQL